MSTAQNATVRATRRFNATAERVFDALARSRDGRKIHVRSSSPRRRSGAALDRRTRRGSFSFVVRRQGEEIDHVGQYLEIEQPRRLVFTWGIRGVSDGDSSRVTLEALAATLE